MRRTKAQISFNMSRIKSKGTQIERLVANGLRKEGIKFTRSAAVYGKPDFVVMGKKVAVFCDSAFWHGYKGMATRRHNFKRHKKFWLEKISRNIERDKEVNRELKKEGWRVARFWDFQITKDVDKCINKITKMLLIKK